MVAKMEWTFYANPNGTLGNLHLWFVPTLDTSKLLFLWRILSGYLKRAIKRETNPTGTAPMGYGMPTHTSQIAVEHRQLPSLILCYLGPCKAGVRKATACCEGLKSIEHR